jgi:hypothetical protein
MEIASKGNKTSQKDPVHPHGENKHWPIGPFFISPLNTYLSYNIDNYHPII